MSLSTPAFTHRMLWHSPTALLANTRLALAAGTLRLVYNTLLLDTTLSSLFQISTAAAHDSPAAQQAAFQKIILYMQNAAASLPKMAPRSVTSILPSTASLCILKIIYLYDKSVCSPQPTSWMNPRSPAGWPQYKETQYKYTRQRMKGERNRGVRSTAKPGTTPTLLSHAQVPLSAQHSFALWIKGLSGLHVSYSGNLLICFYIPFCHNLCTTNLFLPFTSKPAQFSRYQNLLLPNPPYFFLWGQWHLVSVTTARSSSFRKTYIYFVSIPAILL